MAIKKSELYSSLWASCDELRGGMDASQYKDYVLVMLFIKYISDKWAGEPFAAVKVPDGATFADMVELKGKEGIGDKINKNIIAPIVKENALGEMPDFNDANKLGSGKEMVDRLTNLITIFEKPELDFSKNKAEGDDILGDAYEYLMRHFATESGKSKGQFYTPSEVSRLMAKIIGINKIESNSTSDVTVYDPTCGSGSLLLKVSSEAKCKVTLYGQEKDAATSGLARMNMYIHNNPTAHITQGNTLANPQFTTNNQLKTFDFVVANPPFSDKRWSNGLELPADKPFNRFQDFGIPPAKNGDYAYLLHIVRSLKRHGKAAVILPHGVLFRGNAEAEIRYNLIRKGYIKAVIGLPANLFYGTGIPAAILLLDKENAENRKGIFMIDAGKGFIKDGNKNRLREQDIHKIADVFNDFKTIKGYSKMVSFTDIETNDYNLNIPRYIENQETEDIQDIEAHLLGGIPNRDINDLQNFWEVYPQLKNTLFEPTNRQNYQQLTVEISHIKNTIFQHPQFVEFTAKMDELFNTWKNQTTTILKNLKTECKPKEIIHHISENLLAQYHNQALIDKYDMYQHLMNYWNQTMQDDTYLISADGWVAKTYRIIVIQKKKGKEDKKIDKGWNCDLVPKYLVINRFFETEKTAIEQLNTQKETIATQITELEEEHSSEDGYFAEMEKINRANINARIKEIKTKEFFTPDQETKNELKTLKHYIQLLKDQTDITKQIKTAENELDSKIYAHYPKLTETEVKTLVVDDKWMHSIQNAIKNEIDHISQRLTNRVKQLAERYQKPLPTLDQEIETLENKVNTHLAKMGFTKTFSFSEGKREEQKSSL